MKMAIPKQLPTELLIKVFSYLDIQPDLSYNQRNQNITTLCNACLVSRKLYEIAHPCLYTTIEIDISSLQLKHLQPVLREKPHLLANTKALSITQSGNEYYGMQLRHFIQEFLPFLGNLTTFSSESSPGTSHLIDNMLFKVGSSYRMAEPTDFGQVTRLELYAGKMVFEYNYILRLPRLETVCLNALDVKDSHGDDRLLSADWEWTSQTIKNIILRPDPRKEYGWETLSFRYKSLRAMSRSMPNLESLTIEQLGEDLHPRQLLLLLRFFDVQLRESLRRLELRDGEINQATLFPSHEAHVSEHYRSILGYIKKSKIEEMLLDSHVLLQVEREANLIDASFIPRCTRYLNLRHRDIGVGNRAMKMWELRGQDIIDFVTNIKSERPYLERIFLETITTTKIEDSILDSYNAAFHDVGIRFSIAETITWEPREEATGTIVCSMRPHATDGISYDEY